MSRPITVEIDELVLAGVQEGAEAADLVRGEVARALVLQAQPALDGRAEAVAAEVGRAVERSLSQ